MNSQQPCLVCNSMKLDEVQGPALSGVTSDCKPWPLAGEFLCCARCGHVQKRLDAQWQEDIARIYAAYEMYSLSGGHEQIAFSQTVPTPRTTILIERLAGLGILPRSGCLLDIGCGNGAFMRSFNGSFPHWRLSGHEYNELRREEVLNLPGVSDFHSGPLQTGIGQYDMVSMIYVVEHLPNLAEVMSTIRQLLVPGGLFFVHTSHYETNPFDLTVRDHCSHFRPDTLALVGHTAGFTPVVDGSSWIAKEIGMLFRAGQSEQAISFTAPSGSLCGQQLLGNLRWLAGLAADAHRAAKGGLGVFGTAIAGTWLANELGDAATFFVDEDESRQGKLHLGRPVLAPAQLSPSMPVYLPFPMGLAERLHARLSRSLQEIRFLLPPRGI